MSTGKKNILLIDDNVEVRAVIALNLESANYEVVQASDGAEALSLIETIPHWYCIISDLQMPHISGVMFLKIIRDRGLKTPLIFITGFNNIIETEEAFRLGAQAFITKPFDEQELLQKLVDVESYSKILNRPETEIELEDFYCQVHIDEFISGKKIIYPIFLKLSHSKFVKIAHSGEDLDQAKIDKIKTHGVEYFYLGNEDFKNYLKRNVGIAKSLLTFRRIEDSKKRAFFISMTKNLLQYDFNRDIDDEMIAMSLFSVHNMMLLVSQKREFLKALQAIHDFSPTMVEHAMLVSMIAAAIALQSEEFNTKTVQVVTMAALYHDFGMKELPKNLSEKNPIDMTPEEFKLFKSHPQLSSQLISSMKEVPEAVVQGILGHHELADGSGFPFGIGRVKIHPISRILAIANFLAETWTLEENQKVSFKNIVMLLKDKKEIFDKNYIESAIRLVSTSNEVFKTKF